MTQGQDVTDFFIIHHLNEEKARAVLQKFYVGRHSQAGKEVHFRGGRPVPHRQAGNASGNDRRRNPVLNQIQNVCNLFPAYVYNLYVAHSEINRHCKLEQNPLLLWIFLLFLLGCFPGNSSQLCSSQIKLV